MTNDNRDAAHTALSYDEIQRLVRHGRRLRSDAVGAGIRWMAVKIRGAARRFGAWIARRFEAVPPGPAAPRSETPAPAEGGNASLWGTHHRTAPLASLKNETVIRRGKAA